MAKKTSKKKATTKKKVAKKTAKKKTPSIKKDPIKELRDQLKKDGTMELLTLADDDLLSNRRRYVSTQSIALDKLIGFPGVPCGRITEILGDPHTGKSTILDHIFSQAQKEDGYTVLVEPEHAKDRVYTERIGVDPKRLFVAQSKKAHTIESMWRFSAKAINVFEAHPDSLLVAGVDTIAMMPTESELQRAGKNEKKGDDEKSMHNKPGDAAKQIRSGLRILTSMIARRQVAFVVLNQFYEKIGMQWGNPKKAYGGQGLEYASSLILQLRRGANIKDATGRIIGHEVYAKILKSKLNGNTGLEGKFAIIAGAGVDNVWTLFNAFKDAGYITTSGAWHYITPPNATEPLKWQGKHFGLAEKCYEDPELFKVLVSVYQSSMPGVI